MIKCLFFSHYTVQLDKVVDKYKVGRQLFADGSEPYDSFQPNQAAADVAVQKSWEQLWRVESLDVSKHAETEWRQDRGRSSWILESTVQSLCQPHLCRRVKSHRVA